VLFLVAVFASLFAVVLFLLISSIKYGKTDIAVVTKLSQMIGNGCGIMPVKSPGARPCSGERGEICCAPHHLLLICAKLFSRFLEWNLYRRDVVPDAKPTV